MSDLARAIHDSGRKIVLAVTGGGIGAIAELLTTPGASRSILEATIPYASASLTKLLGGKPDQFCSEATARAMAMACYQRAVNLSESTTIESGQLLGGGCTASLRSERPKQGDHRIHVAIQSDSATLIASVRLQKGRRSRVEEDQVASSLFLNLLNAAASELPPTWVNGTEDEPIDYQRFDAPHGWKTLLAGDCSWASGKNGDEFGETIPDSQSQVAIYPGAFHPRHEGHEQIAHFGSQRFNRVIHEISIRNVEKPPLDFLEMSRRAAQFGLSEEIVFTRVPTFVQKARVFPGCTFLVGVDTIRRISHPKYYGGEKDRDAAISELEKLRSRFLVLGRTVDGTFREFDPTEVTPTLAKLCEGVSEQEFRLDISSSELRVNRKNSDSP
jgi:nicotinamide mononucleotide (NMN) deamidase PncC